MTEEKKPVDEEIKVKAADEEKPEDKQEDKPEEKPEDKKEEETMAAISAKLDQVLSAIAPLLELAKKMAEPEEEKKEEEPKKEEVKKEEMKASVKKKEQKIVEVCADPGDVEPEEVVKISKASFSKQWNSLDAKTKNQILNKKDF